MFANIVYVLGGIRNYPTCAYPWRRILHRDRLLKVAYRCICLRSVVLESVRNYPRPVYIPTTCFFQMFLPRWKVYGATPLAYTHEDVYFARIDLSKLRPPPEAYTSPGSMFESCVPFWSCSKLRFRRYTVLPHLRIHPKHWFYEFRSTNYEIQMIITSWDLRFACLGQGIMRNP